MPSTGSIYWLHHRLGRLSLAECLHSANAGRVYGTSGYCLDSWWRIPLWIGQSVWRKYIIWCLIDSRTAHFLDCVQQPDPLTQKNVIFVPIQYRLGTLGILGDGTAEFSGNAALFDMSAAVRWTYDYIQYFGGDPKQITVMGHGSGATAAMYLTTSRVPRSMVSGVVAMSGSPYQKYTTDDAPKQSVQDIARFNNCPTTNETEIVRCLREVGESLRMAN